ncbi:ArsR/SmtB family transcription factor [Kyrpidia spormannii]|uniref:ArsR/SmtB family transcription factor n=1 Tax=Kyrpidia spormannii TaxID=2055160 RepID=UPI001E65A342|nr:metalloregulator ArsR/SmtB family transcription factor [Kyrpidia spormannii]
MTDRSSAASLDGATTGDRIPGGDKGNPVTLLTHMVILHHLTGHYREMCVCELVEVLKMTQPAVSQHLRKLKHAGLVKERKTAQWVFYRLDGSGVPFLDAVLDALPGVEEERAWLSARGLRAACGPGSEAEQRETGPVERRGWG